MPVPPRWRRQLRFWVRRSPVVWWIGVAALALTTAVVVRASVASAAAQSARFGGLRSVPVVARPVAAGEVVSRAVIRIERRPASTVPRGALFDVGNSDGERTALVPLVPGEVVVTSKLAPDGLRGAAALLPRGMRAVSVPGGPGGRPPANVGDRVDVLATFPDGAGGGDPTSLVATRALVLALDDESDAVTVAVSPDELPAVVSAITAGTVTLALTGP